MPKVDLDEQVRVLNEIRLRRAAIVNAWGRLVTRAVEQIEEDHDWEKPTVTLKVVRRRHR